MTPVVAFHELSKWYGNVIGVNKLTLTIPAGVTGLLGPNGAGKSTLLQLATGWDFVYACARLSGLDRATARDASARTIDSVGMTKHQGRAIRGYSKGMRQRIKMAQSLVHDPTVLFLDEPFTGTDPIARRDLMDIVLRLSAAGKSVIVSSHVLHEVQSLTSRIVLLNHGRLVAEGHVREIRDLIDKHPHHIVLACDRYRELASIVLQWPDVEGVRVLADKNGLLVETRSPDAFYGRLPELSLQQGLAIQSVYSDDDNLEAVFKYLVTR